MIDPEAPAAKKPRKAKPKTETASEVVDPAVVRTKAVATLNPLEKIRAGLARLKEEAQVFDVTTKDGEAAARAFRRQCVSTRSAVDDAYEKVNRPLLTLQRDARALRDEIKASVLELEAPIDDQIQALETERERKAQEKREAEERKQAAIRTEIIRVFGPRPAKGAEGRISAATWRETQATIEAEPINDERFPDFTVEAQEAKCAALEWIAAALAEAQRWEADQADLARQREEIAEQKRKGAAERAERDRLEDERIKALRAKEDAERAEILAAQTRRLAEQKAELDAREAEQKERQRVLDEAEAERRRQEAERQRAENAERDARLAREQAEEHARLLAQARLERAAPLMLETLRWISVEAPGGSEIESRADAAIAAATISPPGDQPITAEGST